MSKPIYLYVKQHNTTGLKYFGRTIQNPFKYNGSGSYWINHLKKHGYDISTLEVYTFDDQDLCTDFALNFSRNHNIVESKNWANQIPEDGTAKGGFPKGHIPWIKGRTKETDYQLLDSAIKRSAILKEKYEKGFVSPSKGKEFSENHKENLKKNHKGMVGLSHSPETLLKMKETHKKIHQTKYECIHCKGHYNVSHLARWHGDNCKLRPRPSLG